MAETTLSATLNPDALRRLFGELSSAYRGTAPAPTICRIGSALVEKGSYLDAASVFEYATTQLGCQDHRTLALSVQASFMAKQYALAKESVAKLQASWQLSEPQRGQLQELAEFLDMVVGQEQRGSLMLLAPIKGRGISAYKRVDIEAEEEKTRPKFTELVAALVAPGFDEAIVLLEKVIKRRKERFEDDYPEGQVNLGLFYGAARRFEDAVKHLTLYAEPAVTRVAGKDNVLADRVASLYVALHGAVAN